MCLIGLKISTKGSLLIAANRDEYADRPTAAMHWWSEGILAGKDLKAGGTWLGVTKSGRFAAVTNVRDPLIKDNPVPRGSRGLLVKEFLLSQTSPQDFIDRLNQDLALASAFNLIVGTVDVSNSNTVNCWWLGGRTHQSQALTAGSYVLSNAELNTPWPKALRLQEALEGNDRAAILQSLQHRTLANDDQLPRTGVPWDWEKRLSAAMITGEDYHTRSTTLIEAGDAGVTAHEITWYPNGQIHSELRESFSLV